MSKPSEGIAVKDWDEEHKKASAVLTGQRAAQEMTRAVDDRAFVEEIQRTVAELKTKGTLQGSALVAELTQYVQALTLATCRIGMRGHVKNAVLHLEIAKRAYELMQQIAQHTGRGDVEVVYVVPTDAALTERKAKLLGEGK